RFQHLIRVDHEVLPQHRQAGVPNPRQVAGVAAEMVRFGDHAHGAGPAGRVKAGLPGGVDLLPDVARGRGPAFNFGDDAGLAIEPPALQGGGQAPAPAGPLRRLPQQALDLLPEDHLGHPSLARLQPVLYVRDDLLQAVAHPATSPAGRALRAAASRVQAASSASFAAAAPESIASAAAATPSRSVDTAPAASRAPAALSRTASRRGPGSPARIALAIAAFAAASPPVRL